MYNVGMWTEKGTEEAQKAQDLVPLLCSLLVLFSPATAARFVESFIQSGGAGTGQGSHHMSFTLLYGRADAISPGAKHCGLLLDLLNPIGIELSDIHVNAHFGDRGDTLGRGIRKISGQSGYG